MTRPPADEAPPGDDGVPGSGASAIGWLPRGFVVLLGTAATVIAIGGLRAISWLVAPLLLALVIVITLAPVRSWLRRWGLPRWAATLVFVVLVYAVLIALALTTVASLAGLATLLPRYADRANELVDRATTLLAGLGMTEAQVRAVAESLDLGRLAGLVGSLLSGLTGVVSGLVFLLALLWFLSLETGSMGARIASIAADRPRAALALRDFTQGTRRYMLVTTLFGLIVAVLDAIALALLGIPLPVLWGLLSFVTNYVPNIGFVLGVIPPALLGLLIGGWGLMLAVIVIYVVLNFIIQSLIQPRYTGAAVGVSATVAFVSLVFWVWVLGPLGAILAVPLTLLTKVLLVDMDPRARWADALLREQAEQP